MNAVLARRTTRHKLRNKFRSGTTLALMAVLLPVVLAVAAYSINVVYMELARTELQITTDVATRAAGKTLAVTGDRVKAIAAAERLMRANPFANQQMNLSGADLVFGASSRRSATERYSFVPTDFQPNAVRIEANGKIKVPMLFPTLGVPIDFRPLKMAVSTQTELDIALVLDRSGSMAFSATERTGPYNPAAAPIGWTFGQAVPPNSRWLDAVAATQSFLSLLDASRLDESVSLVSYSSDVRIESALTKDLNVIRGSLKKLSEQFNGGGTNIGDGIIGGINSLADKKNARKWASRVMIVMTDGIHNGGTDPVFAAQQAAARDIQIFTITFSSEADLDRMRQVAEAGSGEHFHATDVSQLSEAFKDIAERLPTLLTY